MGRDALEEMKIADKRTVTPELLIQALESQKKYKFLLGISYDSKLRNGRI